jgi:hypothetical protein
MTQELLKRGSTLYPFAIVERSDGSYEVAALGTEEATPTHTSVEEGLQAQGRQGCQDGSFAAIAVCSPAKLANGNDGIRIRYLTSKGELVTSFGYLTQDGKDYSFTPEP